MAGDARIYIRYKERGYEGQEILFPTTDRERAFIMSEEDMSEIYFFEGDNQRLNVYEGEKLIEKYEWRGEIAGFQLVNFD